MSRDAASRGESRVKTVAYDHQIFSAQRVGGVSRYFCEIAARVSALPDWQSVVVAPVHFNEHLRSSTVRRLGCHIPMRVPRTGAFYRATNVVLAPLLLHAASPAVVHRTYYSCWPRTRGAKVVVTVFDMIHEIFPQSFVSRDHTAVMKRRAVHEADAVICISRTTAHDLQRLLDVPPEKIVITHLGCAEAFSPASTAAGGDAAAKRPYLLYVGHRAGYKNFARLLNAYAASARLAQDFDLVVFGGAQFTGAEQALIASSITGPGTVRRQTGSDSDLARAYAGARAMIYPSEYEGFGIPLLEAMSVGCPVICSNASSIPEVAGEAGEYFDPRDSEAIRAAIERVAYDDGRRQALIARGRARCLEFSWERCTAETLALYRRLHP